MADLAQVLPALMLLMLPLLLPHMKTMQLSINYQTISAEELAKSGVIFDVICLRVIDMWPTGHIRKGHCPNS